MKGAVVAALAAGVCTVQAQTPVLTTAPVLATGPALTATAPDTTCINPSTAFTVRLLNGSPSNFYAADAQRLFGGSDGAYCFTAIGKNGRFLYNCAGGQLFARHIPEAKLVHVTGEATRCKSTWAAEVCKAYTAKAGTCKFSFYYPVGKSGNGLQSLTLAHSGGGSITCIDEVAYYSGAGVVDADSTVCRNPNWRTAFQIQPTRTAFNNNGAGQVFNDRDSFTKGDWAFNTQCVPTPPPPPPQDIPLPPGPDPRPGDDPVLGAENCFPLGCYVDSPQGSAMTGFTVYNTSGNGNKYCQDVCLSRGFPYSGTEYYHYCYCSNTVPAQEASRPNECNTYCSGNSSTTCGGNQRLSVQACLGISGRVFEDTNNNGRLDTFEPASSVTVDLQGPRGSLLRTLITDSDGYYRFGGVYPGTFTVRVHLPNGKQFTVDPDVNVDGRTEVEIYPVGQPSNSLNRNFGYVKINQCTRGTHNCDKNARCVDGPERFFCECNYGYTGDGKVCSAVPTQCTNGSYYNTNTDKPYCSPGSICGDLDECREGTHTCHPLAVCTNTFGSFTCTCSHGTNGDGVNSCKGPVTCGTSTCDAEGTSVGICTDIQRDIEGLFRIANPVCMCHVGYTAQAGKCVQTPNRQCANTGNTQCTSKLASTSCVELGASNYFCQNVRVPPACPMWTWGNVEVGSKWQWVQFRTEFKVVPVIIAGPATRRETDSVAVQIGTVNTTHFQIRLQEPSTCGDRRHTSEIVSYIAVIPNTDILISGSNVFLRAGFQPVLTGAQGIATRISTGSNGQVNALVAQVQGSKGEEVVAAYAGIASNIGYLSVVGGPEVANSTEYTVGYVAVVGGSPGALTNIPRGEQLVIRDQCGDRNALFFYGQAQVSFTESTIYYGQMPTASPQTPQILIGGWGQFSTQNVPAATGVYTNFRLTSKRATSAVIRGETGECLADRSPLVANPFFTYMVIVPGYEDWTVRGMPSNPHRRSAA